MDQLLKVGTNHYLFLMTNNKSESLIINLYISGGKYGGWGHVFRSLAVIDEFKKNYNYNFKFSFFIIGTKEISSFLENKKYSVSFCGSNKLFANFIKKRRGLLKSSISIVDGVFNNMNFLSFIKKNSSYLVFFDDLMKYPRSPNLLIHSQINKKRKQNNLASQEILTGYKYFITDQKKNLPPYNKFNKNIVVCLGGSINIDDIKFLLIALKDFSKVYKIKLMLGFNNLESLYNYCKTKFPKYEIIKNYKNKLNIFRKASLLILGGGFLKYEAALVGTPALLLSVSDPNQRKLSMMFQEYGTCIYAGKSDKIDKEKLLVYLNKPIFQPKNRQKFRNKAMKLIDGNGGKRVIKFIINSYKSKNSDG